MAVNIIVKLQFLSFIFAVLLLVTAHFIALRLGRIIMNTFIHHEGSTYIQYSKIKRQRKREREKKNITMKYKIKTS